MEPAFFGELYGIRRYQQRFRVAYPGRKPETGNNISANNHNEQQDGSNVGCAKDFPEVPRQKGKESNGIESKQPFASRVKRPFKNKKRSVADSFFLQEMPSFSFEITD